jgi:hypothetical protein
MKAPRIAICSYHRSHCVTEKTLAYLNRTDFPKSRVDVFVVDEDRDAYRAALKGTGYLSLQHADVGMAAARRSAAAYYDEGQPVFFLDDDVRSLGAADNKQSKLKPIIALEYWLKEKFQRAAKAGARLWGIYPVANPFFMTFDLSTDLRLICGYAWGVINTHDDSMQVTLNQKEDYERTILYYQRDGAVARFNWCAGDHAYTKEPGGMQDQRTEHTDDRSIDTLLRRFPLLCKSVSRWNRRELKLVDKTL